MSPRQTDTAAPHADVAARFRHFLEACGLDRDAFVAGVDGAIEPRTLYPILNGTRRPSRALAVLIERTWGFRADHLLDGQGPAWAEGSWAGGLAPAPGLTDFERELVTFTRRSLDNVHSMRLDLDRGQLWERLFARTAELIDALDRDDGRPSPVAIAMVFDDCLRAAAAFERFTVAIQRRRSLQLTLAYFDRYLAGDPGAGDADRARAARRHASDALTASRHEVAAHREHLEAILDTPSPIRLLADPAPEAYDALAAIVAAAIPGPAPT
ncbi:MAG TPA: hypothetical protein VK866_19060 [Acidimicrobiales bacterium]|nr:hypothetical protein [Acidimicrobiales bacterium]